MSRDPVLAAHLLRAANLGAYQDPARTLFSAFMTLAQLYYSGWKATILSGSGSFGRKGSRRYKPNELSVAPVMLR